MKTLWILLLSAWSCVAALPPGVTGKMIFQYPNNPTPPQSFLVLEDPGNGSYNQSSLGQIFATFGGSINNTNFALLIGQNGTNFTLDTSNALYLTIVSSTNLGYILNFNGNGTNTTNWGVSSYQEIDAGLFYGTNFFTLKTNAQYTATDGDGKLIAGTGLPATNVLLSAGANITFTTNGDGTIVVAGSGTSVITIITNNTFVNTNTFISTSNAFFNNTYITNLYSDTITNNTFVNTNTFISTSNAFFNNTYVTNLYASTNFSTNFYSTTSYITNLNFVSGKGNTLTITNVYIAAPGSLINSNTANNSAVITDSAHAYTNAVNAVGAFTNSASGPPSFGLIQSNVIAAGISPILNLQTSTNLLESSISSPTNGVNSASAVDFSVPEATTNIAGAVSFTSLSNFNQTNYNHAIRWLINRTGSDQTITVGTWETDSARQTATTYICTNNTTLGLLFGCQINFFTNVTSCKTFR